MKNDTGKTRMQFLLANTGFVFTETDYQALSNHIEVHKYLINQRIPWTVTWDDAAFSWLENVFRPIMQVVDRWEVLAAFPRHTRAQLFFDIANHWYYFQQKHPEADVSLAAMDYAATYGKGLGRWISKLHTPRNIA